MNQSVIDELKALFRERDDIALAILFGSLAQGTEKPDSDLDVAVAMRDGSLTSEKSIELIELLATRFGRPVDLIDLLCVYEPLRSQILTKGEMLICRDLSLYESLIKAMWYDQADIMPYRERILRERRRAWINS